MNFFKNLSISRFVISLYGLQVSRSLKTRKAIKSGLQGSTFFSQILCLQSSVFIIHGHCIQLSFSRAQLSKKFICMLSVSLDFFPDLLFYTKIAFRFQEKETLGIAVLQSNGVTNIITVYVSFYGGRKTGEPGEKPSEQGRDQQQTQPTYDTGPESNPGHIGGRRVLSPLRYLLVFSSVVR